MPPRLPVTLVALDTKKLSDGFDDGVVGESSLQAAAIRMTGSSIRVLITFLPPFPGAAPSVSHDGRQR
jgi:hypothetical protein